MPTTPNSERLISEFKHGQCYPMAVALSRTLGWEIGALIVDLDHRGVDNGLWPHPVHAYVISPDGRFLDAGGFSDEATLKEDFLDTSKRIFSNPRFERFSDAESFLTTLRHFEEGHWDGASYDPEVYATFDYSHDWSYQKFLDEIYTRAIEAIEVLGLEEMANERTMSM